MKFRLGRGCPRPKINTEYVPPLLTNEEIARRKQVKKQQSEQKSTEEKSQPKPLFLILQKEFFDEIIAGTKTKEYREDSDFHDSRFLTKDHNQFKRYDTVIFQNGYHKNARRITVEIKKITLQSRYIIHLGKVIDKNF